MTSRAHTGVRSKGGSRRVRATLLATAGLLASLTGQVAAESLKTLDYLVALDSALTAYDTVPHLEGNLTITGSDSMGPLMDRLALEFSRLYKYPDVKVYVEHPGSAVAMREFLVGFSQQRRGDKSRATGHASAGLASILASSRPMTPAERAAFESRYGHEPMEVPIAEDAVAIYVHQSNPLRQITLEQLNGIFGVSRDGGAVQDIRTWGQLGLDGNWQHQPIHLHGRDKRSGTREFFMQTALRGGQLKPDVQEDPGSASEVLAIGQDPFAIGYAGIGFQSSVVRALPLATHADQPGIAPTAENIANKSYPLRRILYLYVNQGPKQPFGNPLLQEFLKFVTSREGQQAVAKAQFFPLSKEQMEKNMAILTGSMPGGEIQQAALPNSR